MNAGAPRTAAVVAVAYLAGSIPFSQLAAMRFSGTDLRRVGTGTVSGTALYEVGGFGPLALAGVFEVAKGAVGPLLAGRDRPWLVAGAVAAGIAGHNWSPWLGGAGGRGLSPALGASAVAAPEACAILAAGMLTGRVARRSGVVTLCCALGLVPLLAVRRGARGVAIALSLAVPMIAKRVAGNRTGRRDGVGRSRGVRDPVRWATIGSRLLYDREPSRHGEPGEPDKSQAPAT